MMTWQLLGSIILETVRSLLPICGLAALYGALVGYRQETLRQARLWPMHVALAVVSALAVHSRGLPRIWIPVPEGTATLSLAALATLALAGVIGILWVLREKGAHWCDALSLWTAALCGMAAGAQMGRISALIAAVFVVVAVNVESPPEEE